MFYAIIDTLRPLKNDDKVTVTMTCNKADVHAIVDQLQKRVIIYNDQEAPVTDSRAIALANIHSVVVQIAETLDMELNQVSDDYSIGLTTAMEFDKESGE